MVTNEKFPRSQLASASTSDDHYPPNARLMILTKWQPLASCSEVGFIYLYCLLNELAYIPILRAGFTVLGKLVTRKRKKDLTQLCWDREIPFFLHMFVSLTSEPMSPFRTMYSLLRKSTGLMERASSLVKPSPVFAKRGTWRRRKIVSHRVLWCYNHIWVDYDHATMFCCICGHFVFHSLTKILEACCGHAVPNVLRTHIVSEKNTEQIVCIYMQAK